MAHCRLRTIKKKSCELPVVWTVASSRYKIYVIKSSLSPENSLGKMDLFILFFKELKVFNNYFFMCKYIMIINIQTQTNLYIKYVIRYVGIQTKVHFVKNSYMFYIPETYPFSESVL